jgi:hypothetical protein
MNRQKGEKERSERVEDRTELREDGELDEDMNRKERREDQKLDNTDEEHNQKEEERREAGESESEDAWRGVAWLEKREQME